MFQLAGCLDGLGKRVETLEQAIMSGEGGYIFTITAKVLNLATKMCLPVKFVFETFFIHCKNAKST
jgi:hypothetical protein